MKVRFLPSLSVITRVDLALASLVFILSLTLYMHTLAPSLVYSDGAEFQTLAYTLGMSHPTGYPIYLLLGKLFTYIPLGDVAYRVNLMSAVFGAFSLAGTYLVAQMLSGQRTAALLAPLWLGTNGIFWSQAIMAEISTIATLFTIAIVLLVFLWRQNNRWPFLLAAGFLGGLGVGVHSSVLLIAPAILLYLCLTARTWTAWLAATIGAALGVVTALTSFILISRVQTPTSYYNVSFRFTFPALVLPASNLGAELNRVFFILFARSVQGDVFANSNAVMLENIHRYWDYLADWLPLWGLAIMLVGLVALLRRYLYEGLLLTVSLLFSLFFMFSNNSYGLYVFCIPSYVLLSLLLSFGTAALQDTIRWLAQYFPTRFHHSSQRIILLVPGILLGCLILWIASPVIKSWQAGHIAFIDNPGTEIRYFLQKTIYPVEKPGLPHDEASSALKVLPPRAILFSEWNELYTYFYVATVEQKQSELEIYEVCKFAQPGSAAESQAIVHFIQTHISYRPIYFTKPAFNTCTSLTSVLNRHYRLTPVAGGRLWKVTPKTVE